MKLYLKLELIGEFGRPIGQKVIELDDEVAARGDRISNIKPPALDASFDDAVTVMKVRRFRHELLKAEATRLGAALAEHLEDKEGWHGERRQELVRALADTER